MVVACEALIVADPESMTASSRTRSRPYTGNGTSGTRFLHGRHRVVAVGRDAEMGLPALAPTTTSNVIVKTRRLVRVTSEALGSQQRPYTPSNEGERFVDTSGASKNATRTQRIAHARVQNEIHKP
jgi:hypothetical protein